MTHDAKDSLSKKAEDLLYNGIVYICGRDIQCRPIIWINLSKIDYRNENHKLENFKLALKHVLIIAQTYMWNLGKVESFLIVIDAHGVGGLKFN